MSSFKAYIDVDEYGVKSNSGTEQDGFDAKSELKLLPGEVVVSSAESVLKFAALSQQRQGISGALFVTNFKISFVTADRSSYELVDRSFQNNLLGESDVCLANIESIHQVFESGHRKKKLLPGTNVSSRVQIVEIHCKDFRILTFSFKFTSLGQEKAVINAILHHAFPPRVQLLFCFEYKSPSTKGNIIAGTRLYTVASDWQHELQRLHCDHKWRISHVNEHFLISKSLPETFVVPSNLLDEQLTVAASHFRGNRVPTWSWSKPEGCAIVRSSGIHPGISDSMQMGIMLDFIRATHPHKQNPYLVELDSLLPPLKDIQQSYLKLRELCMPESCNQFWEQDARFFSHLDNTKWISLIAQCLGVAKELAAYIYQNHAIVVLQETEGRDMSCLISSLIQIILDSNYRTIVGFQGLIQKEWVAMGYPFAERHKLLRTSENEECPVFLVFLDCVWQILQQFPAAFEFTEIYLTTLWDCTHLTTFDTLLFNSCWDRWTATRERPNPLQTRSLWNWATLLTKDEMALFRNPLYTVSLLATDILNGDTASLNRRTGNPTASSHEYRRSSLKLPYVSYTNKSKSVDSERIYTTEFSNLPPQPPQTMVKHASTISLAATSENKVSFSPSRWRLHRTLPVNARVYTLKVWAHCYFRWIPLVEIFGGGSPIVYMERCNLVKEIMTLQKKITSLTTNGQNLASGNSRNSNARDSVYSFLSSSPQARLKYDRITSAFPYSPGGSPSTFGLPTTFNRQSNYVPSDDELDSEDTALYDD